ncbi:MULTISPECIES: metallophosphoesterase [unclassified Paenibacillus]|uniref:metallophosphoesterase n=1 Tax=unclassified Paenibacillus TaxID=185978 RepID=UPI002404F20A|nr:MULTISPECIES: metallophosphoesterase [unclassified Paenibacillus]MDF9842320.1 putative phosphodiesterase [Paenibacillus sp. PastF-2]MDF9848803.1 putative phosphodiesterase [Paenibacillus sp. PastM-2]MDF9855373.1 putative phosphodiesterase [Paenibacillus sp. PastF-1]MDH6480751.1 putative phosphodiesterase [Paenibacillus sp. PastH-2]MDH6508068.1 putative phosphodiesterase [Paenibacillus sp. PastM-3]
MKQFDLISNIHLDFWLRRKGPTAEDNVREVEQFAERLLPQTVSEVLVIAGDLGHRNQQNVELLLALRQYYSNILVVAGNHDYYLVNSKERYKLQTSMNRWSHIAEEHAADPVSGCYYFDGSEYIAHIDGKVWYSSHVHINHSYRRGGCLFVNNALGYPNEYNRPQGRITTVIAAV